MALTLYYSPGSSSMATHIALHEVGAPFELKLIELYRNDNRNAGYLAVNPEGKVPTLVIDGGPPLTEVAATIHPSRRAGDEAWRAVFRLTDVRLGKNEWAVGRYSIADIHLFRLFWRFVDTLHPPASDYPNLSAHYDRMMARDAVKKTLAAEGAVGYHLPR